MKNFQHREASRVDHSPQIEGDIGIGGTSGNGPRVEPRTAQWEADLTLRDAPTTGKADSWDELNHLDASFLEFSMASDLLRGVIVFLGLCAGSASIFAGSLILSMAINADEYNALMFVVLTASVLMFLLAGFCIRFDLRLPKDRPVRFNRKQGKVYANTYTWNHNPFGRWKGGVRVFHWNTLQAEVTKHIGISGEVVTQRYSLDLVVCKSGEVGPYEEVERFRLQQGAQTIGQYAEQWEFIRRYMNHGLEGLPSQTLREQSPRFADCLLFMMPWFAPTEAGRRFRKRHRNPFVVIFMLLMAIPFPLWLVFGLGNYVVIKVAPEAVWPRGMDEESRQ